MQLHLELYGDDLRLPLAYRPLIQGMIYNALRDETTYSAQLHDQGEPFLGRQFKLFTFGQLEGKYVINGGMIHFPEGARLELRSVRDELLLRLFAAFSVGQWVRLGSCSMVIRRCWLENIRINSENLVVDTLSPIVSYITEDDGKTRFFSPHQPEFYAMVQRNACRKWASSHPEEDFTFSLLPAGDFRKQVTMFKSTRITAWGGRFCLMGKPEELNFLYHTGLGAKNSQGFGMFKPL